MWLELALASGAISAVCGSILAINKIFPAETKRFLRIVRAELTAGIPVKRKRPTVDLALHAGVEVDIKWWDEEFAKLERAIPGKNWYQMMDSAIRSRNALTRIEHWADDQPYDLTVDLAVMQMASEAAERDFIISRLANLESVTDGNVTYSRGGTLSNRALDATQSGLPHSPGDAEECELCEYVEVQTYASQRVKRHKSAKCWHCYQEDIVAEKVALSMSSVTGEILA